MGSASGVALPALIPGELNHSASGVRYRIYARDGKAWLSVTREDGSLKESRELLYFIGSGGRGRTYLFEVDGFYFESPVNWYTQAQRWDMTPAYKAATTAPLNLPAAVSCLHCHTSGFRAPHDGTQNEYGAPLFAAEGVSCERCHGPAEEHLRSGAKMRKIEELSASKRDSICMQCHLEGNAAIEQPGKHIYDFRPGDELSEYVHYLVLSSDTEARPRAVSQFEALAQSQCKRKAGDALRCTTCHDPHGEVPAAEKAAYYRKKCAGCHGEGFAATHHKENPDCTACHMPKLASGDVAHTQATDHRILRNAMTKERNDGCVASAGKRLERFPAGNPATERDLVLGWLAVADSGNEFAAAEADKVLPQAVKNNPKDPLLLTAYAYRELVHGRAGHAKELYVAALEIEPTSIDAKANLGVIEAQSGSVERALELWNSAFAQAPWRSSIGMNLAQLDCSLGKTKDAEEALRRTLQFNPDLAKGRQMLEKLRDGTLGCGAR